MIVKEREHLKHLHCRKIEILGSRNGYKQKVAQLEHYFFVKKFDFSDNLVSLIDNSAKIAKIENNYGSRLKII